MKKYNHVSETLSYVDNFIKENGPFSLITGPFSLITGPFSLITGPFSLITGYGQGEIILLIYLDRYPILLNKIKVIIISSYRPLDPQWSLINRTLRC